ncbi:antigen WC1.1-like [Scleropages formosus]|uniref:antigen WC1.1-like n=1 Tax=Scleropages formosus TaxID=113540 RepID=UPI0010FAAE7F|nr:antigen WC1.1-like [Scleropages formosus]
MEMESCLFILMFSSLLLFTTADSDVRLVNGNSPCEGRVEVRRDEQWGTVCDDDWDMTDSSVVCRQMFCGDAVAAPDDFRFGPGTGNIWMDDVSCQGSESTLKDCEHERQSDCSHIEDVGIICSGNRRTPIRLVQGTHLCSGRVEIQHGITWHTVCDADFDLQDAEVVCRQLGCGIPAKVLGGSAFGKGGYQMWTEEIQCTGNESNVYSCPKSSTKKQNCSHDSDTGLVCSGYTNSRLVDSPDSCSGRVELQYLTEWGTMCDASWDLRAANVLCQQLGCGSAVAVPGQAWFGEGSGPIWADVFECHGKETHLSQCAVSSWNRAVCSHGHDAGVICNGSSLSSLDGTVRLSGESGCEGQLEVQYQHTWSKVLLDSWSIREASVACRQLGCGSAVRIYSSSLSGTGDTDVCLTGYQCSGTESHLVNCNAPDTVNCSSSPYVSIVCSSESLRLVGDEGGCAGRLEVFHQGSWGTVCDDSWDLNDAQVVCRQLQCGTALRFTSFGPGNGSIWLGKVGCVGNESSLWDCPSAQWRQHDCGHEKDVGVVCSEFKDLRLADGCSGQLEVYYNDTWGNVCFNEMDKNIATLICQQLNCGTSGTVSSAGSRVKGAPNWLDSVKCRPHDSTLWQCPSSPWGHNTCGDNDVANITCESSDVRLVNGNSRCAGRVEILHQGQWGTVCSDDWDMTDAAVVCRQLGCGDAVDAPLNAHFGPGTGNIWKDDTLCGGTEPTLKDCASRRWGEHNCDHNEDAGAICSGCRSCVSAAGLRDPCEGAGRVCLWEGGIPNVDRGDSVYRERVKCLLLSEIIHKETELLTLDGMVRLSGEGGCEGQLEVDYQHTWSRVLLDPWSIREASVVCRQLGCGSAVRIYSSSLSGTGDTDVCLTGYQCSGTESHLVNCSAPHTLSCSSSPYVSIVCSKHRSLRLVGDEGGCAGRLEVFHQGSWGTVCDDSWDLNDAQVVCRQLQCGTALRFTSFGPGNGSIWLDEVGCVGNESSLWDCPSAQWGNHDCIHKEDVGVVCSEYKDLRLAEGCSGQLEVYYNDTWGNVCFNQMDTNTVSLICQQLNCGKNGTVSNTESRVKGAPNWLDIVKCRPHDSALWQCPSSPWGQNKCDDEDEVALITCERRHPRMHHMSNLEADGLQQKTTLGSTPISQIKKVEAAVGTGSPKLDS